MNIPGRLGIVGSGAMAKGLTHACTAQGIAVSQVLTRRPPASCTDFPQPHLLTNDIDVFLNDVDVVIECSGDPIHATDVIDKALSDNRPVITINSEFHVTTGSYFAGKGYLTEGEGDQTGCLAALHEDVTAMGFKPLVYGNVKGYLNHTPSRRSMQKWANRQQLSLEQTTSFTDGTKLHIEQALVANGLGANLAQTGMIGLKTDDVREAGIQLATEAKRLGYPISDYVLKGGLPGVFIAAEHTPEQQIYLEYLKMGSGPYYVLLRNYHLCHLELLKTVRRVFDGGPPLLTNGKVPRVSALAVTKRSLPAGQKLRRGIGSFEVWGKAGHILEYPDHVPIGLLVNATLTRDLDPEAVITFADVELPDSLALRAWKTIRKRVIRNAARGDGLPGEPQSLLYASLLASDQ